MSQMTTLSDLINARQAEITSIRDEEKENLNSINAANKTNYKFKADKAIKFFNEDIAARKVEDDATKAEIANEFAEMKFRAEFLIEAGEEDLEYSLAEAAALLATENGQLADAVVAARAATVASYESAKADFGFDDLEPLKALLSVIFDD